DVEDVGTLGPQPAAVLDRQGGPAPPTPVGERVGGDVDHPHHQRVGAFGQPGDADRPGRLGSGLHRRAHRALMSAMTSERVAALCMMPRTAEVIVLAPGLRTPRIVMHRCSASMTTIAPRASRISISESATWVVSRSWTWGRLA